MNTCKINEIAKNVRLNRHLAPIFHAATEYLFQADRKFIKKERKKIDTEYKSRGVTERRKAELEKRLEKLNIFDSSERRYYRFYIKSTDKFKGVRAKGVGRNFVNGMDISYPDDSFGFDHFVKHFVIVHEIGHYLIHSQIVYNESTSQYEREWITPPENDDDMDARMETEATYFAEIMLTNLSEIGGTPIERDDIRRMVYEVDSEYDPEQLCCAPGKHLVNCPKLNLNP